MVMNVNKSVEKLVKFSETNDDNDESIEIAELENSSTSAGHLVISRKVYTGRKSPPPPLKIIAGGFVDLPKEKQFRKHAKLIERERKYSATFDTNLIKHPSPTNRRHSVSECQHYFPELTNGYHDEGKLTDSPNSVSPLSTVSDISSESPQPSCSTCNQLSHEKLEDSLDNPFTAQNINACSRSSNSPESISDILKKSLKFSTPTKLASPIKAKTKTGRNVTWADSYAGKSLTHVLQLEQASEEPPSWPTSPISRRSPQVNKKTSPLSPELAPYLVLQFRQPVSNYADFHKRLEENHVVLENVVLPAICSELSTDVESDNDDWEIKGTIKVKNISFEKVVILRITYNDWITTQDMVATYFSSSGPRIDTFQFSWSLEKSKPFNCLQFCILYKANGINYWDNNHDHNYTIQRRDPTIKSTPLFNFFGESPSKFLTDPDDPKSLMTGSTSDKWCGKSSGIPGEMHGDISPYW